MIKKRTALSFSTFLASLLSLLLVQPALAQPDERDDDDDDEYGQIEEMVVTARKREESLQETPISIAAFSGEGLEERGINDLSEVGEITPNLIFDFTGPIAAGSSAAAIYIRGIGQLDWALPTDPGVGIYVDGIYIARSIGGVLDLLDLERVEVLRGPQGTLFGRNTIGGALSLTTRKPDLEERWGDVQVQLGSYNQTNLSAKVNLPLGSTAALGLSLSSKTRDGYVENLDPAAPDLGDENSLAWRAAFRYAPNDRFKLDVTYDATQERETPAPNVLVDVYEDGIFTSIYNSNNGYDPNKPDYDPQDPDNMENNTLNATTFANFVKSAGIDLAGPTCSDITNPERFKDPTCFNTQWAVGPFKTYSEHKSRVEFTNTVFSRPLEPAADLDLGGLGVNLELVLNDNIDLRLIYGSREIVDGYWARDADHSPVSILQTVNDYDHEQTTFEVQVLGQSSDNRLKWIAGYYSFAEQGCHLDVVELPGSVFDSGGCIDNSSTAFFGQATYEINERMSFTGGLRATNEDKEFTALSKVGFDFGFGIPVGVLVLPDTPNNISSSETDPYLNLAIRPSDNVNLYVSYASGFKGGGFDQRTFPPSEVVPGFEPEFATTVEFGFKTLWGNNSTRLNGAVFLTDYTNLQVLSQRNDPETGAIGNFTQNAAEATINGVEVELQTVPTDNLLIEAGLGLLNAGYDTIDPEVKAGPAPLQENFKLINTPETSLNLAAQYRLELASSSLTIRGEMNHTSEIFNDALNAPILKRDALSLINFALNWELQRTPVTLTFNIRNLTDETYVVTGFDNYVVGLSEAVYGMPQTVSIRAKYEF